MNPIGAAREQTGLSLTAAAKAARVSEGYLRKIERSGDCSYPLAGRLSKLYCCNLNTFIETLAGRRTLPTKRRAKRKTADRGKVGGRA